MPRNQKTPRRDCEHELQQRLVRTAVDILNDEVAPPARHHNERIGMCQIGSMLMCRSRYCRPGWIIGLWIRLTTTLRALGSALIDPKVPLSKTFLGDQPETGAVDEHLHHPHVVEVDAG